MAGELRLVDPTRNIVEVMEVDDALERGAGLARRVLAAKLRGREWQSVAATPNVACKSCPAFVSCAEGQASLVAPATMVGGIRVSAENQGPQPSAKASPAQGDGNDIEVEGF